MYADDTTLYFNVENFIQNKFENECKFELTKLTNWLQHNKLSLRRAPRIYHVFAEAAVLYQTLKHYDRRSNSYFTLCLLTLFKRNVIKIIITIRKCCMTKDTF